MSRSARRGTLASIAAELGVSRTTVSNAYNRPDQLSPELREKILRTAQHLGYPGPDPTARSLRTRRAGAIGVLLTEELTYAFEDQASLEFMSGVSAACGNMGVSMLLIPAGAGEMASEKKETTHPGTTEPALKGSDTTEPGVKETKETANQKKIEATNPDKKETTGKATTLINQASVDGFIVYSVAKDDPYLAAVNNRNLPTVICDQPTDQPELNYVGIDDKRAIQPVVRKLTDAGHRKIGILCIRLDRQPNNGPVSAERLKNAAMHVQRSRIEGVLEVLAEVGVERANVPIVERHINDAINNRSAAEELLDKHPEITAVVCTVDNMALAVAELAADRGWNIPEQLSITGFDGIPKAVELGITTVRQPSKDKGLTSGSVLAALIAHGSGGNASRRILLETTVIEGNSIGAPRVGAL